MSASDPDSSVFLADTDKQIQRKIGNAFSGGQDTRERHREIGGRTEVDIPFQYLTFFLEDDDELERIRRAYETGEMESGEMKKTCTGVIQAYVRAFRERRKHVTEEVLEEFLRPRRLEFGGGPEAEASEVLELERQIRELRGRLRELRGSQDKDKDKGKGKGK